MTSITRFEQIFLERLFGKLPADSMLIVRQELTQARFRMMVEQNDEMLKELETLKTILNPAQVTVPPVPVVESSGHIV